MVGFAMHNFFTFMCLGLFKVFYIVILVSSSTYTKMCLISGRAYEKLVTLVAFG